VRAPNYLWCTNNQTRSLACTKSQQACMRSILHAPKCCACTKLPLVHQQPNTLPCVHQISTGMHAKHLACAETVLPSTVPRVFHYIRSCCARAPDQCLLKHQPTLLLGNRVADSREVCRSGTAPPLVFLHIQELNLIRLCVALDHNGRGLRDSVICYLHPPLCLVLLSDTGHRAQHMHGHTNLPSARKHCHRLHLPPVLAVKLCSFPFWRPLARVRHSMQKHLFELAQFTVLSALHSFEATRPVLRHLPAHDRKHVLQLCCEVDVRWVLRSLARAVLGAATLRHPGRRLELRHAEASIAGHWCNQCTVIR